MRATLNPSRLPLRLVRRAATAFVGVARFAMRGVVLVVVLVVGLAVLVAAPVFAGEDSPLERLKPEERAVLERKIPDLGALSREQQEQIVRNVERLRSLDPQALERMKQRLRDAGQAGLRGERLDERVRDWAEVREQGKQGQALVRWQGMRAVALRAWRELPDEMRRDVWVARVGERAFAAAFDALFWGQAWRGVEASAALAHEPAASLLEPERMRLLALRERARAGDARALGRLQEEVLRTRALEAVREARKTERRPDGPPDVRPHPGVEPLGAPLSEAVILALGERLRALAPKAYDEAREQLVRQWREKGGEAWARLVLEKSRPGEPPPEMRQKIEALRLAFGLEEFAARHPELGAHADALLRAALVDELGMSADEFSRLPPRGDAQAQQRRREVLGQWAQRSGLRRLNGVRPR